MKECRKCKTEKEFLEFRKQKAMKDGYSNTCKVCDSIAAKEYRVKNKERVSEKKKIWRENNKEKEYEQKKIWRENNKEKIKGHAKDYYDDNKEILQEYGREYSKEYREKNPNYVKSYYVNNKHVIKEYYKKNKEHIIEKSKEWQERNKDIISEKKKQYYIENREYILDRGKKYYNDNKDKVNERVKNRLDTDELFKLSFNIRCLIRNSFKRKKYTKDSKTQEILGCTIEEFKMYLESMFEDWMTWENRGLYNGEINYGWDIDHIIPLSSAETKEDILKLNHYSNFQPLCGYINRHIKSNSINHIH